MQYRRGTIYTLCTLYENTLEKSSILYIDFILEYHFVILLANYNKLVNTVYCEITVILDYRCIFIYYNIK